MRMKEDDGLSDHGSRKESGSKQNIITESFNLGAHIIQTQLSSLISHHQKTSSNVDIRLEKQVVEQLKQLVDLLGNESSFSVFQNQARVLLQNIKNYAVAKEQYQMLKDRNPSHSIP